MKKILMIE